MKGWMFAGFLAVAACAGDDDPVARPAPRVEDCANAADDDGDGSADCLDADCGCDADGDGVWGPAHGGLDCDDANAALSPNHPEICNGVDDDCDAFVDDADPTWDPADGASGWVDGDGDGHGGARAAACAADPAWAAAGDDCDDADPAVSPSAPELCGGVDDDCDGLVDEADPSMDPADLPAFYADRDGDGHGDAAQAGAGCVAEPASVLVAGDCDDGDPAAFPGAAELCWDGVDQDCDGADACHPAVGGVIALEGEVEGDPAVDALGTWIAAGDLDGDGWPELAVADAAATWVTGAVPEPGLLLPGAAVASAATPGAVLAGPDWSGDGIGDLAWVTGGVAHLIAGPVPAAFSPADAFATHGAGELDGAIAAGDLDGDGAPDLAAGGGGAVLLDHGGAIAGDGAWDAGVVLAAADLDGDGRDELAVGAPAAGEVRILPGDAASAADAVGVLVGPAELGRALAAGDADGDGDADLAVGGAGEAWVLHGLDAAPALVVAEVPGVLPVGAGVALVDLDGDGAAELATAGWIAGGGAAVWVVPGGALGAGTVADLAAATLQGAIGEELGPMATGDLDRDGYPDLAVGAPRSAADPSGRVLVLYGSPL